MASGRLGAVSPAALTNTTVYTVPASKLATFNVSITNTNASPATIRLALAATGTPTSSEWILYNHTIEGYTTIERTGIILDALKLVVTYCSIANISVVIYGMED